MLLLVWKLTVDPVTIGSLTVVLTIGFKTFEAPTIGSPVVVVYFTVFVVVVVVVAPVV